ncbi:MAG: autotransporter domain-containing protein [Puniceicoccales bacterium]|nr:autotransporter domain-containing protein [Puniceicoccales bacterium]
MLHRKIIFCGCLLLGKIAGGFESPYTELASLLKNSVYALDSSITQHSVEAKKIFPRNSTHPIEIFGTIGYAHGNGKYYDSDGGIAFAGFDFSYDNFILKRTCAVGFFGGTASNNIDYHYNHIKNGRLNIGFAGYYCNFHIWGFDVSTTSIMGFGTSHTNAQNLICHGINFDHFTHHHRILHSKIDIYYPWKWHNFKIGPNVALRSDNLKQNGAKEWSQTSLRLQSIDGIAGIKCEKDSKLFYAHCFLGANCDLRKHWSGETITIHNVAENFTCSAFDSTQLLLTAGIHFRCTESCFFNFHFSGRYGKRDKSSTFGITLNKIF